MDHTYWLKQTADQPLFPDLLWSRPENKARAGKLLVVGGNIHGFAAAGEAYGEAGRAGAGTVRVLLPDRLQKTVGRVFPEAEFASSTPSGSFGRQALAELLAAAEWADGVLLAGDFGRNSETAIVLEQFVKKYAGQLTLAKDAVDYFTKAPAGLLDRQDTLLVTTFAQLQKIATNSHFLPAFKFDMDLLRLVEASHEFSQKYQASVMIKHLQNIFVAASGQVSSTKLAEDFDVWRVATAAHATTWWLQNPTKRFEAITTSLIGL